jgi:hypothetical protein
MRRPCAEELAAIAAAFLAVARRSGAPARPEASRWSLAWRIARFDAARVRVAARAASRWNAAGRLDG